MAEQRKQNFVPLQPAPTRLDDARSDAAIDSPQPNAPRSPISRAHEPLPPKRRLVSVACEKCRSKRTKCDGQRPRCTACIAKGEQCIYGAQEGETISSALKRKLHELEDENTSYKELYRLLKTRPEAESIEIVRRIRISDNPREVWQYLKDAELLLASSAASSASASASASASMASESRATETTGSESDGRSGKSLQGDREIS